jgi:hypothetical protein
MQCLIIVLNLILLGTTVMGSPVYDYAFPAVDRDVIQTIGGFNQSDLTSKLNSIKQDETANLIQSMNSADGSSNNSMAYAVLLNRNKTISDIATDLTAQNKKVFNGAKDTYARQAEINEWQAQNKLDTLFFLQILFLFFALTVVLLFLRQYGILPSTTMYILLGTGLFVVIAVLWNRASYTSISRDKRYWNRRFMGLEDAGGLSAKMQCSMSGSLMSS